MADDQGDDDQGDAELDDISAAVAERLTWGHFVRRRSRLTRTTESGLSQVIALHRNYGGPPEGQGGDPELSASTSFQVHLGAKLLPGSTPRKKPFLGLDADVTVNLGQTRRLGSHPDFAVHRPESVDRVVALLEPYGRRWFQRYDTLDKGLATLEKLDPTASLLAGDHPVLTAMRLRAARGEWDAVVDNLAGLVFRAGRGLPREFLRTAVDYAASLGLPAEAVPEVVTEQFSDAPPVGLRALVLNRGISIWHREQIVRDWLVAATEDERLAAADDIARLLTGRTARHDEALRLAGAGTAPTARAAVDALGNRDVHPPQLLVDVLRARDVDWLDEFVGLWTSEHPAAARATVNLLLDAGQARR